MEKISLHALPHLGFLHAQGTDVDAFLQGQLSNDLQLLTPDCAQLSSYNSPKGRMLAVLWLTRANDGVLLELERSILDATLKRLRMFVLRSKLTMTDVSSSVVAIGISGVDAPDVLRSFGLPIADTPCAITTTSFPRRRESSESATPSSQLDPRLRGDDDIRIMRRHGAIPRFSLHGPVAVIEALRSQLAAHIPNAGAEAWQRLDILAGVPVVLPQTSDHFVPQMANLDQLDGISFNKGCYTGQEIVARLHYLGTLKRRLFHCRTDALNVQPGTFVYEENVEQAVGEVVRSAHAHNGSLLSAVLQLSHAQSHTLRLGSPTGPALSKAHEHTP